MKAKIGPKKEDQKKFVEALTQELNSRPAEIQKAEEKARQAESGNLADPQQAAKAAQARLDVETKKEELRRLVAVADWVIKDNPFPALDEKPAPPPAPRPSVGLRDECSGPACEQLKAVAHGRDSIIDNSRQVDKVAAAALGFDPAPPTPPRQFPRSEPSQSPPVAQEQPREPPVAQRPAIEQRSGWEHFLKEQPEAERQRLAQQFQHQAEEKKRRAAELTAALEGHAAAAREGGPAIDRWADQRARELEAQRDAGLRAFDAVGPRDVQAAAERVATPRLGPDSTPQDVLHHVLGVQRAVEAVRGALEGAGQELVAGGLVARVPGANEAPTRSQTEAMRDAVSAADSMFGPRAAQQVATLITGASGALRGARDAVHATMEIERLKLIRQASDQPQVQRALMTLEQELLRSGLNVAASVRSEFTRVAEVIRQGGTPSFIALPLEIQEALYPRARGVGAPHAILPPALMREAQPGGIKFAPSQLDPTVFQLEIDSLYFDRREQNLVLSGKPAGEAGMIDAEVLAAALLLAAQGGPPPWFSLDPINSKDWDGVGKWIDTRLNKGLGFSVLQRRFLELRRAGKVFVRETSESVELYATLEAFDRRIYDRLLAERETGVHLAFSHEFLRFTEAGRILFEADKALKRAVEGRAVVGDSVLEAGLGVKLSDQPRKEAGRGDFAPVVVGGRAEGIVGVKDLTVLLELTARHEGTDVDDEKTKVPFFEDAKRKFNGNIDGARDRILASSPPIAQLRQFFKAYFSAKALMERNPGLRERVLASVRPPFRQALPQAYYESPVVILSECPAFLQGGSCPESPARWFGTSFGFGGGISFGDVQRGVSDLRDAPVDAELGRVALIGREVARGDRAGVVTEEGRSYVRVGLFPTGYGRDLGEIDLKHPERGISKEALAVLEGFAVAAKPLSWACALAGLLAALVLGGEPWRAGPRLGRPLAGMTALAAGIIAASAAAAGGFAWAELIALLALGAGAALAVSGLLRRERWGPSAAAAIHLSWFASCVYLLGEAYASGGSMLRGKFGLISVALLSLGVLAAIAGAGAPAGSGRWTRLCARCRALDLASLSAEFLAGASWVAAALFFAAASILATQAAAVVSDLPRIATAILLSGTLLATIAGLALVGRVLRRVRAQDAPTLSTAPGDLAAACLVAGAGPALWAGLQGGAAAWAARAAALGAAAYLLSGYWRGRLARRPEH